MNSKPCISTDFLFARPSFLSGAARLFDFGGFFDAYNRSRSESEADGRAMYADWRVVGQDIQHAVIKFVETNEHSNVE
jgi:hypothetical protein